jgi:hypothetical protein
LAQGWPIEFQTALPPQINRPYKRLSKKNFFISKNWEALFIILYSGKSVESQLFLFGTMVAHRVAYLTTMINQPTP